MSRHVWSPVRGLQGRAGTGRAPPQALPGAGRGQGPPGPARRCRPARILGRAAAPGSASESPRSSPAPARADPRPRAMARGRRGPWPGRGHRPAAGAEAGRGHCPGRSSAAGMPPAGAARANWMCRGWRISSPLGCA